MNNKMLLQNEILRVLFNSSGRLDSFTLFRRMKVSFKEFTIAINTMLETGLLVKEENIIYLSETGRKEVLSHAKAYSPKIKPWREIPSKMLGQKLHVDEPYIPSIRLLDKKTFNI